MVPAEEGALRIMIPVDLLALLPSFRSLPEKRVLWGTSQMPSGRCDNSKNLAFAIEPPANPTRPTLRDGH
jgi:hypothetical protein